MELWCRKNTPLCISQTTPGIRRQKFPVIDLSKQIYKMKKVLSGFACLILSYTITAQVQLNDIKLSTQYIPKSRYLMPNENTPGAPDDGESNHTKTSSKTSQGRINLAMNFFMIWFILYLSESELDITTYVAYGRRGKLGVICFIRIRKAEVLGPHPYVLACK